MNVLIVDDEPLARARLRSMLEKLDGIHVAGEAGSGLQAIERVESLDIDVLLLDIRMPGMNGLEVSEHVSRLDNPPAVIFTTAYSEHALEAFDAHAIAYLLKPVEENKLVHALENASKLTRAQLEEVVESDTQTHICVKVRGSMQLIDLKDIYYFRADMKYIEVKYTGGQVLMEDSLNALEEKFADTFQRAHRNALVSIHRIKGLNKQANGQQMIVFDDIEDRIEVSRRLLPGIRAVIKARAGT